MLLTRYVEVLVVKLTWWLLVETGREERGREGRRKEEGEFSDGHERQTHKQTNNRSYF